MNIDRSMIRPMTDLDIKTIETNIGAEGAQGERQGDVFHYAAPLLATTNGTVHCVQCHESKVGDVLGVIRLSMDVSAQRRTALWFVTGIALLSFLFGVFIIMALRRMMQPIVDTTADLNAVLKQAEAGDFSARLQRHNNDEIGKIAERTNQFMQVLEDSFGQIIHQVKNLVADCGETNNDGGLLTRTVRSINNLVSATHFKQAIENHRDLPDVYGRIDRMLSTKFGLTRYSPYEIASEKNQLKLIFARGLPEHAALWCDRKVSLDCNACPAKRTAQAVSSARR